jgi:hypothetical protein
MILEREMFVFCHNVMGFEDSPNNVLADSYCVPGLKATLCQLVDGSNLIKDVLAQPSSYVPSFGWAKLGL